MWAKNQCATLWLDVDLEPIYHTVARCGSKAYEPVWQDVAKIQQSNKLKQINV